MAAGRAEPGMLGSDSPPRFSARWRQGGGAGRSGAERADGGRGGGGGREGINIFN